MSFTDRTLANPLGPPDRTTDMAGKHSTKNPDAPTASAPAPYEPTPFSRPDATGQGPAQYHGV